MKNLKQTFAAFSILPLLLSLDSCEGNLFERIGENVDIQGTAVGHEMIVLGARLNDPYSVENMTMALESVLPTRADRVVLDPTDLYVRFLPADEEEFDVLEALGLQLLDHPVDHEILREGDYYHDPSIDADSITWQYAVVDSGFKFPQGIKYEILDRCYIPGHGATKAYDVDWEAVERAAYELTGNAKMLSGGTKGDSSSRPKGRITIVDDMAGGEPAGVRGVKVSCNSFVKFGSAYTDDDGNYEIDRSFSSEPRYRLVFKNRLGFAIGFNLLLVPASFSTLGKNSAEGVSVNVTKNSEHKLFTRCVVNNAAADYYDMCKQDEASISLPPGNLRFWIFHNLNSSSAPMLHQGTVVEDGLVAEYLGQFAPLLKMFLPDITLGVRDCESYADIYGLAAHELAHASHFMQAGKDYWNRYINFILKSFVTSGFVTYGAGTETDHGYCEVGEMWAYYMQTMMWRDRYASVDRSFGTNHWFSPQILISLDERGLSRYRIFGALSSDVHDKSILRTKLIYYNAPFKSVINQIFARYN